MTVVGDLPSWLDVDFAQTAAAALCVVAVLVVLGAMFWSRSIVACVLVIVLMGASVVGLLHYRETLSDCETHGCECKLFGENLEGRACTNPGS